jgi:diguanylate cyclase (GGDEF)-like protein/PAS domain S-box-containing protein
MSKDANNDVQSRTKVAVKRDFVTLLKLMDQHYDRMEATISQSLSGRFSVPTPIEVIFDSVTDALLSVSVDGVIRNCNKVCTRYFGLSREELIGSSIDLLLPGLTDRSLEDFLAPVMANLDETQIEFSHGEVTARRISGAEFVAEINASRLKTSQADIFVISLRDITERKEAERALRENEERYRALVEHAPEAIVVLDIDKNRFCDVNDKACELFNLSRKRLLTIGPKAISPSVQPDGRPSFGVKRGYVERAMKGEHPVFEWTHCDAGGREFACEVRFSRLPAGDRRLLRVSITDISERKVNDEFGYAQNKILEMVAAGASFDQILRATCRAAEKAGPGLKAAVMILDRKGRQLSVEAAPSLPEECKARLDLIPVGAESFGSGLAVHEQRDKIVADIAESPAWGGIRNDLRKCGIRGAWSFPVRGDDKKIVGAVEIFVDRVRQPGTDELDRIAKLARLVGIAIKRRNDEQKLRSSELRYRGLFENVVDGVYIASRDGDIITVNPALVSMLGFESADALKNAGRTTRLYVNPVDRERVMTQLEAEGYVRNFEYRLRRKDGREIVVLENARAIYDDNGKLVAHEGTVTDITERKRAETRIFEEKERAQVTLQSIGDGVITTDAKGYIDYLNPVAEDLTGWSKRSVRGTPIDEIMTIVNEHTRMTVENPVRRCLNEGRVITLAENSLLVSKSGEEIPIQDSAAPIRDRIGNIIGAVMVFHDISKETRLFRQLSYQAAHDATTGLINRREFENQLVAALQRTHEDARVSHALMYLDLDQFKVVNDTFGHTAGDELLRKVTEIIQANVRSTDVVARLGGDEFGILLERCDKERAMELAETLRLAVEEYRFAWQHAYTNVRCSIGVVIINEDSQDVASVMSHADVACYSAKDMGRNQVHLYQDSDASARHEEMKWVSRITSAIEEGRFELYYQPIIGISKAHENAPAHYEVLLRLRDEDGAIVQPVQFIPSAERYNMMSMLDRWVVSEALRELVDRNSDGSQARYTIAINLSGTSLSEDRFLEFVIEELGKYRLPAGAVCFEITETAAISNLSRVIHFMQALKKLGCLFSLDDFGSGLSSFTYLKNLPVDYLKIDGQFISNVVDDSVDESMVSAISQVGHAMGIETIAERVETLEVLEKLAELGVAYAQGYYIARPESVATFRPWSRGATVGASA